MAPLRARTRFGCPAVSIRRLDDGVEIVDAGGHRDRFDAVLVATHSDEALALLAQGRVDVAIIDGARVDRFGNVNHSYVGPYAAPKERLPGAGLRTDAASLARRVVLLLDHDEELPDEVDYISAPGAGSGAGWRESAGLHTWAAGVTVVITPTRLYRMGEDGWLVEEGR